MNTERDEIIKKAADEIRRIASEAINQLKMVGGEGSTWWRADHGEEYLYCSDTGTVLKSFDHRGPDHSYRYKVGNYFPCTESGQRQAELTLKRLELRDRWKRSADVPPYKARYLPSVNSSGFKALQVTISDGLPGWSTPELCQAFVESEGGTEVFCELLKGGIL